MKNSKKVSSSLLPRGDEDCVLLPVGIPKGAARGDNSEYIIRCSGKLYRLDTRQLFVWYECRNLLMKDFVSKAAAALSVTDTDIQKIINDLIAQNLLVPIRVSAPWNDFKKLTPIPLFDVPKFSKEDAKQAVLSSKIETYYDLWLRFDGSTTLEKIVSEVVLNSKDISTLQAEQNCCELFFWAVRHQAVVIDM